MIVGRARWPSCVTLRPRPYHGKALRYIKCKNYRHDACKITALSSAIVTLRTFRTPTQRESLPALRCEQFQVFGPWTHGGNRLVERDEFHAMHSSQVE